MRECPKRISRKLKDINSGLYCRWNGLFNKWQVMHKDTRTSLLRRVGYVQTHDGNYMDITDPRVDKYLYDLSKNIPWDLVAKYDTTDEILNEVEAINDRYDKQQEKEWELKKQEIVKDTMKNHSVNTTKYFMGA